MGVLMSELRGCIRGHYVCYVCAQLKMLISAFAKCICKYAYTIDVYSIFRYICIYRENLYMHICIYIYINIYCICVYISIYIYIYM